MFALDRTHRKFLSIIGFALTFNAFLLHWSSTYVGSTPWLILASGLALFYLPLGLSKYWGISSYPFLFVVGEELRNSFPFGGFGWGRIAYSQADAPYANIAYYAGAISLSAVTLLIALFLFLLFRKRFQGWILFPIFICLIPIHVHEQGNTNVLIVQGNVPEYGLNFNARARQVFYNHVEETNKALGNVTPVDFILWPENAVDIDPFTNKEVSETLSKYDIPLIVGAIVDKNNKTFNTSILWRKNKQTIYIKQHLTPFGEYVPLRWLARKISPLVDQVEDFSPGNHAKIFEIGSAKIAPVICYELIDDTILVRAAKTSNILAIQTNSATFGRSAESAQQLSITRVRAIEHSRNTISVSTTGYSAVINSRGEVVRKTAMGQAAHIVATVGLIDSQSVRDRLGHWAEILTLLWLLLSSRRGLPLRR